MLRPSLHELQYSASLRHHGVITKEHKTQPSQSSITAATRKGSAVRHPPYTTHRIQLPNTLPSRTSKRICLVRLEFFRVVLSRVRFVWDVSVCRCARVFRRSAGTLSAAHNCTAVCSFFCNRHLRTAGGTDCIPAIQRRLLHNQAGSRPGALSLIDPNPEGYIIHYS